MVDIWTTRYLVDRIWYHTRAMGRRRKRRKPKLPHISQEAQLSRNQSTKNKEHHDPWHPVLRWWWSIAAAIFIGTGVELMPMSFWSASIVLIYLGMAILIVGLWFETFWLWLRLAFFISYFRFRARLHFWRRATPKTR